jgi:hypothetical protein
MPEEIRAEGITIDQPGDRFRGQDGAGTLGKQNHAKDKGEFALTAIDNDLFARPSLLWS